MMLTIDRTLNGIWRVRKPRPIAQRVLVYWAGLTLGPLLLGISLSVSSLALSSSRGFIDALPGGLSLLLDLVEFTLLTGGVAALFHYVPNTVVRWRHALAGGVFVTAAFELAKKALAWYVVTVPTYSTVYGAFATVPILLLWIYLGWVIVLLGAVIAAYAPSLQMRVVRRPPTPGHLFELALAVLRLLQEARRSGPHGLAIPQLAEALRADPLQIEPVLERLVALDWAARLDEAGDARMVLLCDAAATPAAPLIDALLLQPGAASLAFRERAGFASMTLADLLAGRA